MGALSLLLWKGIVPNERGFFTPRIEPFKSLLIPVNSAGKTLLSLVPGMGAKRASYLIKERARAGPFLDEKDFQQRLKPIGKSVVRSWIPWFDFSRQG